MWNHTSPFSKNVLKKHYSEVIKGDNQTLKRIYWKSSFWTSKKLKISSNFFQVLTQKLPKKLWFLSKMKSNLEKPAASGFFFRSRQCSDSKLELGSSEKEPARKFRIPRNENHKLQGFNLHANGCSLNKYPGLVH